MDRKSSSDDVQKTFKMRKVKMLICDTPPIKKQGFWVPEEVKIEPKRRLKSISRISQHVLDMNIEGTRIGQGAVAPPRQAPDQPHRRSALDKTHIWL